MIHRLLHPQVLRHPALRLWLAQVCAHFGLSASAPAYIAGLCGEAHTQVLLGVEGSDPSALTVGQRVPLRSATPPGADDEKVPPGLGKSESKPERVEWLMSGIYCTCGMTDGCAGHFYTLAACNSHGTTPCGMAKRTRAEIAEMIDKGQTERQIFEQLLKERGPKILGPHMSP